MIDLADDVLTLAGRGAAQARASLTAPPRVHLTTAAASTLVLDLADPEHSLRSMYATLEAVTVHGTWRVASIKRTQGRTRLVLEDDVVGRLRRAHATYSVPAGSTTVNELAERIAFEAGIPYLLEPTRHTLAVAWWRDDTAWAATRSLADIAGRWRYSDGERVVLASPEWLLTQPATTRTENDGPVGSIDYTVDVGRPDETAAADVDSTWMPRLGESTDLTDVGAASGLWVVAAYTTVLGETDGRVTWSRPRDTLRSDLWS